MINAVRSAWPGRKVLITAGPTREPLDPIRFLTNASSGTMGFALARQARDLGADVTIVRGPCDAPPLRGVRVIPVTTANEMHEQVLAQCRKADVVIAAAAVGDWRFKRVATKKIKRTSRPLRLTLVPNADIIADVARRARSRSWKGDAPVLVGFALETDRWIDRAREKLGRKGLDLIVANKPDSLGSNQARFAILDRCGRTYRLPPMSKTRAAKEILKHVGVFF